MGFQWEQFKTPRNYCPVNVIKYYGAFLWEKCLENTRTVTVMLARSGAPTFINLETPPPPKHGSSAAGVNKASWRVIGRTGKRGTAAVQKDHLVNQPLSGSSNYSKKRVNWGHWLPTVSILLELWITGSWGLWRNWIICSLVVKNQHAGQSEEG